jgi:hypothetical protein
VFEGYFSGGDTDNNPIPNGTGIFLSINASYNSSYLNGQYLTIKDLSPGYESQETHFYTYDEDGGLAEMTYEWTPMTWILGTNDINEWLGQDCMGDIWGTAFEDECGMCSEGASGHDPNSDIDCNGACFGMGQLDQCNVCDGGDSSCSDECGIPAQSEQELLSPFGMPQSSEQELLSPFGIPHSSEQELSPPSHTLH